MRPAAPARRPGEHAVVEGVATQAAPARPADPTTQSWRPRRAPSAWLREREPEPRVGHVTAARIEARRQPAAAAARRRSRRVRAAAGRRAPEKRLRDRRSRRPRPTSDRRAAAAARRPASGPRGAGLAGAGARVAEHQAGRGVRRSGARSGAQRRPYRQRRVAVVHRDFGQVFGDELDVFVRGGGRDARRRGVAQAASDAPQCAATRRRTLRSSAWSRPGTACS